MGVKFGDIDAAQILQNEYRIMVLEGIIERLQPAMPAGILTPQDIQGIRNQVVEQLRIKYPNSGITLSVED